MNNEDLPEVDYNTFPDSEVWSLDFTIARFVYPRLVHFRNNLAGHPSTLEFEEWKNIVDKMIYAFKFYKEERMYSADDYEDKMDEELVKEGLQLFAKWFSHLWD